MDFLGFNIRRYPNGKLLTKPSNAALRRIRSRLSTEMKRLRGSNADAVTATLNNALADRFTHTRPQRCQRTSGPGSGTKLVILSGWVVVN